MTEVEVLEAAMAEGINKPFRIETLKDLEWYGRKLTGKQAEIDALEANYQATRKQLVDDLESFKAYFEPQAAHLARQIIDASGGKRKSVNTLGGLFGFRTVPGGLRVNDKDAALQWAKEKAPGLVDRQEIVKESVPTTALKNYLSETGEVPDGCFVVDEVVNFYHKIGAATDSE